MVEKSDLPEENVSLVNKNNVQIEKTNDVAGMVPKSDVREESVSLVHRNNEDIESAIDAAGNGFYNYLLLAASCLITIGATIDMLGYSLVVPAASCDLDMTLEQGGVIKSVSFAGFLFGLPWGYIADKKGRKGTILVCVTAGFIFSTLTSFSSSFYMMLILKFFSSCFSTAAMTLVTTYLGESTCRKKRNSYIFIQNISSTIGDLGNFVFGYLILPLDFAISVPFLVTYKSWRLCSLVMSLPLGVSAVMMLFLKESPKFLANRGENDKAMEVLTVMFKTNNGKSSVYPVKSLILSNNAIESKSFWDSVVKQTTPVFKPPLLWRSLQLFLLLSIFCATNNAFLMWFPTMVDSLFITSNQDTNFCQKIVVSVNTTINNDNCYENNTNNMIYTGLIFTVVATILHIGCLIFADWRKTLIFSLLIIAIVGCIGINLVTERYVILVLFCSIVSTGLGIGSVYAYYVDVYPTSYRGVATGLGTMVARTLSLGGVAIVGATVSNYCELTFYCWTIFLLSGIIAAVFLPTEEPKKNNII